MGGKGDLQAPQRPVLARYLAGIRFFCPQWLQARITGIQDPVNTEFILNIGCSGVRQWVHEFSEG